DRKIPDLGHSGRRRHRPQHGCHAGRQRGDRQQPDESGRTRRNQIGSSQAGGTPTSGKSAAILRRPIMWARPSLTASTAISLPPRRYSTENFAPAGSPIVLLPSKPSSRPVICSLISYWSDQNHGTGS